MDGGTKTPVIDADCKEIVGIPLRQMLRDHCAGIILKSSLLWIHIRLNVRCL